jgi:hypothetical protein
MEPNPLCSNLVPMESTNSWATIVNIYTKHFHFLATELKLNCVIFIYTFNWSVVYRYEMHLNNGCVHK